MRVRWSAHISGRTLTECKNAADKAFADFMEDYEVSSTSLVLDVSPEIETADGTGMVDVVLYSGTAYAEFTTKAVTPDTLP